MEYFLDYLMTIRPFLGFLTLFISAVGMLVAWGHAYYWSRSKETTAKRMRDHFLTDGFLFAITALFGLGAFISLSLETRNLFQFVREPILIAQIWASVRLGIHIRAIRKE